MSEIAYLELDEVVEIQTQMLDLYGGLAGFRGSEGQALVASALQRPRNKAHYEGADLLAQAAALYFGLAKNHGFLDENKRIAVAGCDAFLQLNGWELACDNRTLADFTLACDREDWTEAAVEAFVRRHAVPLDQRAHELSGPA